MSIAEMKKILDFRKDKMAAINSKLDYIYKRTDDMFNALDKGIDKDVCFDHWVKLFNEDVSQFSKDEIDYFHSVCNGLVVLVDDWMRADGQEYTNQRYDERNRCIDEIEQ